MQPIYISTRILTAYGIDKVIAGRIMTTCIRVTQVIKLKDSASNIFTRHIELNQTIKDLQDTIINSGSSYREKLGIKRKKDIIDMLKGFKEQHT